METELLQNLRTYLNGKTQQDLRDELKEIKKLGLISISVADYLLFLNRPSSPPIHANQATTTFEFNLDTTPNNSGSCFFK